MPATRRAYNTRYEGSHLDRVAFPMGGIGAGMICLAGTGALTHVSLRHKPDVYHEPQMFAVLYVKGAAAARVLEGAVPMWKALGSVSANQWWGSGNGLTGRTYGLPRFGKAAFRAQFPFGVVDLQDTGMPVAAEVTGWSPFVPGNADDASLPVAAVEYRLTNRSKKPVEAVFSFHAANFMKTGDDAGAKVESMDGGFVLAQPAVKDKPEEEGYFAAFVEEENVRVDCAWFRGGWWDALTMTWRAVAAGNMPVRGPHAEGKDSGGGSLYVPVKLKAGESRTIRVLLAWYVPASTVRVGADLEEKACGEGAGCCAPKATYRPWYAARFASMAEVAAHWRANVQRLRGETQTFADCFYDTNLPAEVVAAVAANLGILKSPTCLRQADGRLWGWEGCHEGAGCCHGTCTHVWNYAQALPHLFPALERTLRETEFQVNQDVKGHQNFRASLPVRTPDHKFHAAADGQLGGIMKLHREWRIGGDTAWMAALWPKAKASLEYAIATWDPDHTGTLVEPHHNTYDIEFWGADGMCTSFYLGALAAAIAMGKAVGEEERPKTKDQGRKGGVALFRELLAKGKRAMEGKLFNGEYFYQKVQWKGLRAEDPMKSLSFGTTYTPEAAAIMAKEGPNYQYRTGCLTDGVLGDWMARCCGLGAVVDEAKTGKHVASVFKYNHRRSLADHANPQRPGFAFPQEGGLLMCSWPKGGKPALPFVYSDEVWTGCEYQAASHMIMLGRVKEGLAVVRTARDRYDGRWRNPFDEYECGHWYARAMSSYGLLQACSGARYDAVEKVLYLAPAVKGDFRAFLCTATGYGTVGVQKGKAFVEVRAGKIEVGRIEYRRGGAVFGSPEEALELAEAAWRAAVGDVNGGNVVN